MNKMLNIKARKFRTYYPHLKTDEEKATKILDEFYANGASYYQLAKILNISLVTAQSLIPDIKENTDFYHNYMKKKEKSITDFLDNNIGEDIYMKFQDELDACDQGFKAANTSSEKLAWKKHKFTILSKILDTHLELHKPGVNKNGVSFTRNDLDSRISRAANTIQQ